MPNLAFGTAQRFLQPVRFRLDVFAQHFGVSDQAKGELPNIRFQRFGGPVLTVFAGRFPVAAVAGTSVVSTNLLVDVKFGGENSQGAVEWFVPAQTLFRFPDADTVMVGWAMQQDEFERFGLVARPRVRLTIWRW